MARSSGEMRTDQGAVACSIVARNYLPYARVLAAGWRAHHPQIPLRVLLIDGDAGGDTGDGLDVLGAGFLGLGDDELARMRGIYGPAELTTALKPRLLRRLLDDGAEAVVYLDADTDVHADVGAVVAAAAQHGIVLSPHLLHPPPADGLSPSEYEKQRSGIFNSGFLAVGPSSAPFLDWWAARLRRDCLFSDSMGAHADQLWLNFVPSYFPHHVLRDPGINVAQWNVHERAIRWDGTRYTVDGGPLRTFHFAGFDPASPDRPSTYDWWTGLRVDVAAEPDLQRLSRAYGVKLTDAGIHAARRVPYRFASSAAGVPMTTWRRRAYRELLLAAEARRCSIPDPFDAACSPAFERMLADPAATGLLSSAAEARLADGLIAEHVAGLTHPRRARHAMRLPRQLARRAARYRQRWAPHPLPSDRTLLEYRQHAAT
jgi:hypothetical protein